MVLVVRGVFVVHQHLAIGGAFLFLDVDIAEGFGGCDNVTTYMTGETVKGLTMVTVQCFLAALTIIDADGSLQAGYL